MLIIVHGDDIVASRKYFTDLKDKHVGAHSFDGASVTLTDLAQIFEGGGLFEDSKTVFIEQLLTKKTRGRKTKTSEPTELDAILAYFDKHASLHTIILWENKEIEKGVILGFKTAEIKIFRLPQTLFLFLDNIKRGNGKILVKLFHQTIANTETEMVFFMLVRQIRLLLALTPSLRGPKQPSPNEIATLPTVARNDAIDEIKRMQPWQKTKLQKQAASFTPEELKQIYHKLFQIEVGQKTGSLSLPVRSAIDFLLLDI